MRLFILFILLIALALVPVSAQNVTISFSDLNILQKDTKILIYKQDGSFIGEYNTTDTVTLDTNSSYIFVFKPSGGDWFSNPFNSLELLKEGAPTIFGYILFGAVIGGLAALIAVLLRG